MLATPTRAHNKRDWRIRNGPYPGRQVDDKKRSKPKTKEHNDTVTQTDSCARPVSETQHDERPPKRTQNAKRVKTHLVVPTPVGPLSAPTQPLMPPPHRREVLLDLSLLLSLRLDVVLRLGRWFWRGNRLRGTVYVRMRGVRVRRWSFRRGQVERFGRGRLSL